MRQFVPVLAVSHRSPMPLFLLVIALVASCSEPEGSGNVGATGGATGGLISTGGTSQGGTMTGGLSSGGDASGGQDGGGGSDPGGSGGTSSGGSGGQLPTGGTGGDAGCVPFSMPAECEVRENEVLPSELRCTGLYSDWEARALHCSVREYAPADALWSDGAAKKRYVALPPGTTLDVSDPDDFVYPVGTKFWKEFYVGEEPQTLGETRLLEKTDLGWIYTTYVHAEDGSTTALQENAGVENLFGSGHEVPSREQCKACHSGRQDFVLGWDFFLLGEGATGVTREILAEEGLLSRAQGGDLTPSELAAFQVPGSEVEQAALSYLHVNCGVSCHNGTTNAAGRPSGLLLRLETAEIDSALATDAVTTGMNRLPSPNAELIGLPAGVDEYYDILPLDPERSLLLARMEFRGSPTAMPPLGTHLADPEGVAVVRTWIEAMTEDAGYPPPAAP